MALFRPMARLIRSFQQSYERHSLAINIATNVLLITLCLAGYAFLLTLYLSKGMWTDSFVYVKDGLIPPTTAITICGVLLTGVTSALLTRCAEHSLWDAIIKDHPASHARNQVSPDEAHRQAQWTISPIARLAYAVCGQSWTLRLGGLFLLGTAVINPVLLYGVSPGAISKPKNAIITPTESAFAGYMPKGRLVEFGSDSSIVDAALASMNHLKAPTSNVCNDVSCSAKAYATAMQAECLSTTQKFTDGRSWSNFMSTNATICSSFGHQACIKLAEETLVNFTSGPSNACIERIMHDVRYRDKPYLDCPAGDFAVIYGTWSSPASTDRNVKTGLLHTVDCQVYYGNATISQSGRSSVELQRDSFVKSEARIPFKHGEWPFGILPDDTDYAYADLAPSKWQTSYLQPSPHVPGLVSPYTFAYTGENFTKMAPLRQSLITSADTVFEMDAAKVARAIEANFDMATLFAFAKSPQAASVNTTYTSRVDIWRYDSRVLTVLAIPLVASILVISQRWMIYSNDVVIGYNPHLIARRAGEILASTSRTEEVDADNWNNEYIRTMGAYATITDRQTDHIALGRLKVAVPGIMNEPIEPDPSSNSSSASRPSSEDSEHQSSRNTYTTSLDLPQETPVSLGRERAYPADDARLLA